jgi:hypothetical protein
MTDPPAASTGRSRAACSVGAADGVVPRAVVSGILSSDSSGNLDVADLDRDRPASNERRQQRKRLDCVVGLDAPPDRMTAGKARGRGGVVAERAPKACPRGKRGGTFTRGMPMMEKEVGHAIRVPVPASQIIRGAP